MTYMLQRPAVPRDRDQRRGLQRRAGGAARAALSCSSQTNVRDGFGYRARGTATNQRRIVNVGAVVAGARHRPGGIGLAVHARETQHSRRFRGRDGGSSRAARLPPRRAMTRGAWSKPRRPPRPVAARVAPVVTATPSPRPAPRSRRACRAWWPTSPHSPAAAAPHRTWWLAVATAIVMVGLVAFAAGRESSRASAQGDAAVGMLVVSSHPSGAQVTVDGQPQGPRPLAVRVGTGPRAVVVTDAAGASSSSGPTSPPACPPHATSRSRRCHQPPPRDGPARRAARAPTCAK